MRPVMIPLLLRASWRKSNSFRNSQKMSFLRWPSVWNESVMCCVIAVSLLLGVVALDKNSAVASDEAEVEVEVGVGVELVASVGSVFIYCVHKQLFLMCLQDWGLD